MTFLFEEVIPGGALFYPCSGDDFAVPLAEFVGLVDEFWFVDIGYNPGHGELRLPPRFEIQTSWAWKPPPTRRELWSENKQRRYPWVEPRVLTQRLHDRVTGRVVTAHWRRGYGTVALAQLEGPLSVFFYRGDSLGEGGSGTQWLMGGDRAARPLLRDILERMPLGGFVVTDGSNCPKKRNPYAPLQQFHNSEVTSDEAVRLAIPFVDPYGRAFECVGSISPRYGPTLVWRVTPRA